MGVSVGFDVGVGLGMLVEVGTGDGVGSNVGMCVEEISTVGSNVGDFVGVATFVWDESIGDGVMDRVGRPAVTPAVGF